jgi:hypothetical protein
LWEQCIWKSFKNLFDDLFVFLFVSLFESHLRVANDAAGVDDERRSPKCVEIPKSRIVSVEDGISHLEFLGQRAGFLEVWVHGDHEDLEALAGEAIVKFLEMNHLLA